MLREIMELRKDPTASAVMGAAFANENAKTLTDRLGRKPTDGELYIAHFLGASGAVRLISAAQTQPNTSGASLFPKAAAANGPVFYDRNTGAARSVSDVYKFLVSKHDGAAARLAATPGTVAPPITASTFVPRPSSPIPTTRAPVPAAPPLVTASANTTVPATSYVEITTPIAQRAVGPIFHGLYNDGNRGAVAPVVRQLWGVRHGMPTETTTTVTPTAPTTNATTTGTPTETPARPPLSLFQFLRPDPRSAA
jgi:hypothetical protein